MQRLKWACVVLLGAAVCVGCSTVEKRKLAYREAQAKPTLEVPPDLLSAESADELESATAPLGGPVTLSEYSRSQEARTARAATHQTEMGMNLPDSIKVGRDGAQRWLIVRGAPGNWWEPAREFWNSVGIPLEREEVKLGIMETEWVQNRSGQRSFSFFRKAFEKLYDAGTRDKFVLRIEPGATPGTAEIYIVHRALVQVAEEDLLRWMPAAPDPELEVEMLKQLALYLGGEQRAAEQVQADLEQKIELGIVRRDENGVVSMSLNMEFAPAWRRVGNALGRMDVNIEDYDRDLGLYYLSGVLPKVEEEDKGFLGKLFSNEPVAEDEDVTPFRVKLESVAAETRVYVLDDKGVRNDTPRAMRFLEQLQGKLN